MIPPLSLYRTSPVRHLMNPAQMLQHRRTPLTSSALPFCQILSTPHTHTHFSLFSFLIILHITFAGLIFNWLVQGKHLYSKCTCCCCFCWWWSKEHLIAAKKKKRKKTHSQVNSSRFAEGLLYFLINSTLDGKLILFSIYSMRTQWTPTDTHATSREPFRSPILPPGEEGSPYITPSS